MHLRVLPLGPPAGALRAALQARSFKNEVIIVYATEHRLHHALQATLDMTKNGYGHVLLLLNSEEGCR